MSVVRAIARFLGWLLTPIVAWATALAGAWFGAVIAGGMSRSTSAFKVVVGFGAVSGILGAWGWLRLLRRSPRLQETLAVAPDGTPLVALPDQPPRDAP